jgi:hypothetical protein
LTVIDGFGHPDDVLARLIGAIDLSKRVGSTVGRPS